MYPLKSKSLFRSNQVSIPLFEEAQVLGLQMNLRFLNTGCAVLCCAVLTSIPLLAWLEQGFALTPPSVWLCLLDLPKGFPFNNTEVLSFCIEIVLTFPLTPITIWHHSSDICPSHTDRCRVAGDRDTRKTHFPSCIRASSVTLICRKKALFHN